MTLSELRSQMSLVELQLQSKFHNHRRREEGQWRIEYLLAQLTSVIFNIHHKDKTDPKEWLIKHVKKQKLPTPEELEAWAIRVNEKIG